MLGMGHLILMVVLMGLMRWRGASFWQSLMGAGPATIFVYLAISLTPVYKQHARLISVLEDVDPASVERGAIKELLERHQLTFVDPKGVKKYRGPEGTGFKVQYAGAVQMLPTVRIELRFDQVVMKK